MLLALLGNFMTTGILITHHNSIQSTDPRTCRLKIDWDQPLDGTVLRKWQILVDELQQAQPISIPRSYFCGIQEDVKTCMLCGFCDASMYAYAAVVYLTIETDADTYVKFVVSKTRVAPLQTQTIPRLELISALLLARLMSTTMESLSLQLSMSQSRCYTDSKVVLFWIQGMEKEWKPFIQNRVNEIRKLTEIDCWNHCPGKDNPADVSSRGTSPIELSVHKQWRNGPDWLSVVSENIDVPQIDHEMPEECLTKLKAKPRNAVHNLLTCIQVFGIGNIIRCEDYSTLFRLLNVTAYVLKFVDSLKKTSVNQEHTSILQCDITKAERLWIIESQHSLMQDKLFEIWKTQFNLFLDSMNVWRCGGRLGNSQLSYYSKHPVILSRDHPFTALIVKAAHERVQHNGVKETLTEIRSKYWIVKGRSLVNKLIGRCILCKRYEGRPFSAPPPPPLPEFRVSEAPPFAYTAIDFAGPLYVKNQFGENKTLKVWICLYKCCVIRAVHLDVVPDMTTATFIRSLKRFCARRGLPRKFISDNGKTFKAAAKTIENIVTHQDVQKQHLSNVRVEWIFNLEKAPWWGGIFERMVRSTKRCLKKMIGQAKFTYDELVTAVIEVEAIIISRPLSYMSADDLEEPLTPSHLMIGRSILSLPHNLQYTENIDDEDFEITATHLNRRARHLNNVLNHFWKRWRQEYLIELRDAHRYNQGSTTVTPITSGEVVLLHEQDRPRGFWKLAKIEQTITGNDGQIRGAVLRVPANNGRTTILKRPVQLLYPLEIYSHASQHDPPNADVTDVESNVTSQSQSQSELQESNTSAEEQIPGRSRHEAAVQAREKIKASLLELEDNLLTTSS